MEFPHTLNTQADLDALIHDAVQAAVTAEAAKYPDYAALQEKARQFDAAAVKDFPGQIATLNARIQELDGQLSNAEAAAKTAEAAHQKALKELTNRAETAEGKVLRYAAAAEKGLPLALADRLHGGTAEELAQDADALARFVTPAAPPIVAPLASTEPAVPGSSSDAALYQIAAALG